MISSNINAIFPDLIQRISQFCTFHNRVHTRRGEIEEKIILKFECWHLGEPDFSATDASVKESFFNTDFIASTRA